MCSQKTIGRFSWKIRLFFIVLFSCFCLWQVASVERSRAWSSPPEAGDGPDYDNIALNLLRQRGYGYFWSDPEFRLPYEAVVDSSHYDYLRARSGEFEATSYRPPLFPSILAMLYRIFGRVFWPWRIFNICCISLALSLTCYIAFRSGAWVATGISLALAFYDNAIVPIYSAAFLTEGLALCLVALLFLQLLSPHEMSKRSAVYMGFLSILLVFARSIFIFWIPWLALLLGLKAGKGKVFGCLIWYFAIFLLLGAPWFTRNCLLLHSFMPFGSQGAIGLPQAYSDPAYEREGVWSNKLKEVSMAEFSPEIEKGSLEEQKARYGQKVAREWITQNVFKLPRLMALKIRSLWWQQSLPYQKILFILSFFGLIVLGICREWYILLVTGSLLSAQTMTVALTWSAGGGRFLIPLHPVLYTLPALAISLLVSLGQQRFKFCTGRLKKGSMS